MSWLQSSGTPAAYPVLATNETRAKKNLRKFSISQT